MHYNFIPLVLCSYRAKKLNFCSPLLNIEKFILQETSQNLWNICHLKYWNIQKISTYKVQNLMKKIEIDEHFVSYYSVNGELFFLNMEYLHQKCFYFLES